LRGWWSPEHEYLFLFRNGKEEARVSCQGLGLLDSNCQGLRHVWKKHSLVFLAGSRVVELSLPELRASTLFTLDASLQLLTGPILLHGSEVVVVMQPWQHKGEAGGRHIVVLSCTVRMEIPCQDELMASCGFMSSLW
jgi:hypothetical protein